MKKSTGTITVNQILQFAACILLTIPCALVACDLLTYGVNGLAQPTLAQNCFISITSVIAVYCWAGLLACLGPTITIGRGKRIDAPTKESIYETMNEMEEKAATGAMTDADTKNLKRTILKTRLRPPVIVTARLTQLLIIVACASLMRIGRLAIPAFILGVALDIAVDIGARIFSYHKYGTMNTSPLGSLILPAIETTFFLVVAAYCGPFVMTACRAIDIAISLKGYSRAELAYTGFEKRLSRTNAVSSTITKVDELITDLASEGK